MGGGCELCIFMTASVHDPSAVTPSIPLFASIYITTSMSKKKKLFQFDVFHPTLLDIIN
jgi:hypothetical protein